MRFLTMRSLPRLPMWGRCGALIYNGVWIVHGLPYWRTRRGTFAPLPSRTSFCEAGVQRTTPCADEKTGRSSLACGTRRDDLPRRRCVFRFETVLAAEGAAIYRQRNGGALV